MWTYVLIFSTLDLYLCLSDFNVLNISYFYINCLTSFLAIVLAFLLGIGFATTYFVSTSFIVSMYLQTLMVLAGLWCLFIWFWMKFTVRCLVFLSILYLFVNLACFTVIYKVIFHFSHIFPKNLFLSFNIDFLISKCMEKKFWGTILNV